MATLLKRKSKKNGKWLYSVQVLLGPGRRPTVPLGGLTKSQAQQAKGYLESLAATRRGNLAMPTTTADWLRDIDVSLYARLVEVGLCEPRNVPEPDAKAEVPTLAAFIDGYIADRKDIQPNTLRNLKNSRQRLSDYFGNERSLADITPGDCDEWRQSLVNAGLAAATISKAVKHAKQFLRLAHRKGLIALNPFQDLRAGGERNDSRLRFVERSTIDRVIAAAPDAQWKLIIALSRYGGLRCPSEHLALRWADIDWSRNRIIVPSPKTARHGKGYREIPLFAELLPYLEAVRDEAHPGIDAPFSDPVITRYRDTNANLRTQLLRIIRRAGVEQWERLFHNLRASRQTELADRFPAHVVARWLGNSPAIAERHYLQTIEAHYEQASKPICAAESLQSPTEVGESDGNERKVELNKSLDVQKPRQLYAVPIPPRGFEPLSPP